MIARMTASVRFLLGIALIAAAVAYSWERSLFFPCVNKILDRVPDPDGRQSAVVFFRDCGVASSNNIQISVVRKNRIPTTTGNALIVGHSEHYVMESYSAAVKPMWEGSDRLILTVPAGARISRKSGNVRGVKILLRQQDSQPLTRRG
jgi:hypothetical protein